MKQLFPMRTASGREVWYLEPHRTQIVLDDVYQAARRITRYAGALDVSLLFHLHLCLALGKLYDLPDYVLGYLAIHDAHEYIVLDLPSQLKHVLPEYKARIEIPWAKHIHESLGYPYPPPPSVAALVKRIDIRALHVEIAKVGVNEGWIEHLRAAMAGEYGDTGEHPPTGMELGTFTAIRGMSDSARWLGIFKTLGNGSRTIERLQRDEQWPPT